MAKFDFNKPVASFSWYLQNGSADDKRGTWFAVLPKPSSSFVPIKLSLN